MNSIILKPKPLTKQSFNQFGDVVEIQNHEYKVINNGYAHKYSNLASIDTSEAEGNTAVHIFVAKKRTLPLHIDMLERHPLFSQCFIPRGKKEFLIVVAPPADKPNIERMVAFISNGDQGVNFSRGVWHFPLISLENESQFIIIDRQYEPEIDNIEQCDIYDLKRFNILLEMT